jgi:ribosome-associated heat shock protein Hsp15
MLTHRRSVRWRLGYVTAGPCRFREASRGLSSQTSAGCSSEETAVPAGGKGSTVCHQRGEQRRRDVPLARSRYLPASWLWTRGCSRRARWRRGAVRVGRARVSGVAVKPNREVAPGDELEITVGTVRRTVIAPGAAERCVSAAVAASLYEETAQSVAERCQVELRRLAGPVDLGGAPNQERPPPVRRRPSLVISSHAGGQRRQDRKHQHGSGQALVGRGGRSSPRRAWTRPAGTAPCPRSSSPGAGGGSFRTESPHACAQR